MLTGVWRSDEFSDTWYVAVDARENVEPGDLIRVYRRDGSHTTVAALEVVAVKRGLKYILPVSSQPALFKLDFGETLVSVIGDEYRVGDIVTIDGDRYELTELKEKKGNLHLFRAINLDKYGRIGRWVINPDPVPVTGPNFAIEIGGDEPPKPGDTIMVLKRRGSKPQKVIVDRVIREYTHPGGRKVWVVLPLKK